MVALPEQLDWRPPKDQVENLYYRAFVYELAEKDAKFREDLFILCTRDIVFWFDTFVWTEDAEVEDGSLLPLILFPAQEKVVLGILKAAKKREPVGWEKGRRQGASWVLMGLATWAWQFRPGTKIGVASRTEDDVDKAGDPQALFWKIDFILDHQPSWLKPRMQADDRRTRMFVNRENGSTIKGSTTQPNMFRGAGLWILIVDEAGAIETLREAFSSVMIASQCWVLSSTSVGEREPFSDGVDRAKYKFVTPWTDFPPQRAGMYRAFLDRVDIIDKDYRFPEGYEFIRDGRLRSVFFDKKWRDFGGNERRIAQELECSRQGASANVFPPEVIDRLVAESTEPVWKGDLEFDHDTLRPIRLVQRENGPLWLWVHPDMDGLIPRAGRFVMGSDIAQGRVGTLDSQGQYQAAEAPSRSVNSVMSLATSEKVAQYVTSLMPPHDFALLSIAMTYLFGGEEESCLHIWDAGGPGHAYGIVVLERGSGYVWYRRNENRADKKLSGDPGIYLNAPAFRRTVFTTYSDALDKALYTNRCKSSLVECRGYKETPARRIVHVASEVDDPQMSGENHGDMVIADMISYWAGRDLVDPSISMDVAEAPPTRRFSRAWRDQNAERDRDRGRALASSSKKW